MINGDLSRYGVNLDAMVGTTSHGIILPSLLEPCYSNSSENFTVISRCFIAASLPHRATSSPDKELRYLRTVIVTADIDEGFGQSAVHIATYHRHR